MRPSKRKPDELRRISIDRRVSMHAEGSCLVKFGNTHVLCTASLEERIPPWLKGQGKGWVTAEYSMLPRATSQRTRREVTQGHASGRTQEIQRLIGRSLRAAFDLEAFGERTLHIDCDVIQADGGTRTAAISGAMVAAYDAFSTLLERGVISKIPLKHFVAAISVGVYQGSPVLDLDYLEDSNCDTDMNVVMTETGHFIEVQGTAEGVAFDRATLNSLLELASSGIADLINMQKQVLGLPTV